MRTIPFRFCGVSTFCLTLAACGASGAGGGSGTTGGGTTGASTTTGGASTSGLAYQGYVIFGVEDLGTDEYDGQAGFYETTSLTICSSAATDGGCCYVSPAEELSYSKDVPAPDVNAGTISLQDGTSTLTNLPFIPGTGYGSVNSLSKSSFTWSVGDSLGVMASGSASGVAAFSGTVIAPAPLNALKPTFATLSMITLADDFDLTWTGTGSGTVTFEIIAATTSAPPSSDGEIICTAPSSGGALTVPAALLANFHSGDDASLLLTMANNSPLSATNANVGLTAETQLSGTATLN